MGPPLQRSRIRGLWLNAAAIVSICAWLAVEYLVLPATDGVHAAALRAAAAMEAAQRVLWAEKEARGLLPPSGADPDRTGMIGPEYTVITTSIGSLSAKRTTASPEFAAALVRVIGGLDLPRGTPVVMVVSGSLVGGDVAAIVAAEALGLRPVLVTSTSASMWGATDPDFTLLDIEAALLRHGIIETRSIAAVIGGTGGTGREMDPSGVDAIRAAAQGAGVPLIEDAPLERLIDRVSSMVQDELAAAGAPGLVINVGGAVVGLGNCSQSYEFPPGLTRRQASCTGGTPGIALRFAAAGVPILHVLNIRRLATEWGLAFDAGRQSADALADSVRE